MPTVSDGAIPESIKRMSETPAATKKNRRLGGLGMGRGQQRTQERPDVASSRELKDDAAGVAITIADGDWDWDWLAKKLIDTRSLSTKLTESLSAEDCSIQSMADASPTRWHLAHTSWFFETFVLKKLATYEPLDDQFEYLFNSYYNTVGQPFPRARRGMISRPGHDEVLRYRAHVDQHLIDAIQQRSLGEQLFATVEVGIHHEQQHQELILMDIKHALSINPLFPAYRDSTTDTMGDQDPSDRQDWIAGPSGLVEIGHQAKGFAFDNESPVHCVFLQPYQLSSQCVTNQQYREFIADGGYERPDLWLSMGWSTVQNHGWKKPLYWVATDDGDKQFTLGGLTEIRGCDPVCHLSYFEADAYARWSGNRLPTEFEWEAAAKAQLQNEPTEYDGSFADVLLADDRCIDPAASVNHLNNTRLCHAFGNVWEWTSSQYSAYPGFKAAAGAIGEYNGKFMCNQFVLRGGSCATPSGHIRPSYRNFFPPETRWQFSGLRLARS